MARKRFTGQKTVRMTRQSVKRVIPKLTSWKSRGARAPVPHSWRRQWSWLLLCLPESSAVGESMEGRGDSEQEEE